MNTDMERRILPFLWVHGESEEVYREMVKAIYDANIRAFCVEARPHEGFCQEPWWRDMAILLDEAEKRDMRVWILDDKHFPTGFAAGEAEKAPVELRRQGLLHKRFPVKNGKIRLNAAKLAHPPLVPDNKMYLVTDIYKFKGWDPEVAAKVNASQADNTGVITYTAQWKSKAIDKDNITAEPTSITIDPTVPGYQYIVVPKGTTPSENDWNTKYKTSDHGEALTFAGLTPGVEYDVICRKPGDDTHNPSKPSAPVTVETKQEEKQPTKTTQDAPISAPNAKAVSSTSIEVNPAVADEEYSIDGGKTWVKPGDGASELVFDGLTPGTEYTVVSRMAETETKAASAPSPAVTVKTDEETKAAEEIAEEEVPLAPAPVAKASWALANLILAVSTIGLALYSVLKKRDESDSDNRKRKLIRALGLAPALAAAVTYLLTEDMSTPMAIVDKWTVLMAGYLALYGVTAFLARDKKTAPEV